MNVTLIPSRLARLLSAALLAFGAVAVGATAPAQERAGAAPAAADSAAASEAEQFKFNLAPAASAPGATAEVLLTVKEAGGYGAELKASGLPDPAKVKTGSTAYVIWLYDPATQKKERVAELTSQAGAGSAAFDIGWPKFALVVTAEPTPTPKEWSGAAVFTGQPSLPATTVAAASVGGGAAPAAVSPQATPAPQAGADPSAGVVAGGDEAAQGAAPAPGVSSSAAGDPAAGAGAAPSAGVSAGADSAEGAGAGVGVSAGADPAADADPAAGAAGGVTAVPADSAAAGAGVGVGVAVDAEAEGADAGAEGEVAAAEQPADDQAATEETDEEGKKRRFRNETLDRMAAAARAEEEAKAEESKKEEGKPRSRLDELNAATRQGARKIKLEGEGRTSKASGKLEVPASGPPRLSVKGLIGPTELGDNYNAYVLWIIDPTSGKTKNAGVLQSDGGGRWSLSVMAAAPPEGAPIVVTAESGPNPATRSSVVVLSAPAED